MRITSISDYLIAFCMKEIVIVRFITIFFDQERWFESLKIW